MTSGVYRRPALVALAIMTAPLAIYGAYLARLALGEGERFRTAPEIGEGRRNGDFYKVTGVADGDLLSPGEYPEVQGALSYRVRRETREKPDGEWSEDALAESVSAHLDEIRVAGLPIVLGPGARVLVKPAAAIRELSPTERLAIEVKAAAGVPLVAYGVYQHGKLIEGTYDRLVVVAADRQSELLEAVAVTGRRKAQILAALAALAALVSGVAAWRARRS